MKKVLILMGSESDRERMEKALPILHEAGGHSITLEGEREPPLSLQKRSSAAALDGDLFREWCTHLGIDT